MLRRTLLGLVAVAAMTAPALPAIAAEPVTIDGVTTNAYPEVSIVVTLPPSLAGRLLPDDAFTIEEGGTEIAPTVRRLSNQDLEVVLLLDVSQSMRGAPLAAAVDAAASFAASLPEEARIGVVTFATEPTVLTSFTAPIDVPASLAELTADGETSLYDGLLAAVGLWDDAAPSRRAVVLLSDGSDTVSDASLEDAIVSVVASGAEFYAVELQSPETDPEPLQRLEAATGGSLVGADDPEAIASIFDEIASVLVSRYELSYTSAGNGPTTIGVAVTAGAVSAAGAIAVQLPTAAQFSPETVRTPVVAATPVPEVVASRVVSPGLWGRQDFAVYGGALLFAGLWGVIRLTQAGARGRSTTWKPPSLGQKAPSAGEKALSSFANRATLFAERGLERVSKGNRLAKSLEMAGSSLRPAEFAVIALSLAVAAAAVGATFGGLPGAVVAGVGVVAIAPVWLTRRAKRRQAAFADQLGDALQLIAGGLLAGHGIIQACDAVANEEMEPASDEFRRLIAETRLGRDFTDALRAMGDRVGGVDFRWVVDAIDINREVGGDLSQVLRTLAATIRSRNQVRRRVQTLSAEGKLSGAVLLALPFVVAGLVTSTNPDYLQELFTTGPGRMMVAGGAFLMAVGSMWIRQIVAFKY